MAELTGYLSAGEVVILDAWKISEDCPPKPGDVVYAHHYGVRRQLVCVQLVEPTKESDVIWRCVKLP